MHADADLTLDADNELKLQHGATDVVTIAAGGTTVEDDIISVTGTSSLGLTTDGTFVSAPSAFRSMETQKFETLANQLGERQALSKQPISLTRAQFALAWRALDGDSGADTIASHPR